MLVVVAAALFATALSHVAMGQDKATAREVVAKVRQAARTLSKTRDLTPFTQNQGPWVWKDTYIFVVDCDKKLVAAHPIKPELVGQSSASLKDTKGNNVFPEDWCDAAKKPSGIWVEYWWPKPGEKDGSRKLSYGLAARGTPYAAGAGIYDDKATVAELSKLAGRKYPAGAIHIAPPVVPGRALQDVTRRHLDVTVATGPRRPRNTAAIEDVTDPQS